ncbi:Gfo/Idh/MocA family protein [Novosphingobium sp. KACC 22771]|uniref:Gfo/Idh/MocA family protein n=1 Tax=Novosphingobium sp. KACC 22771 TaxID=3025670 RepID=UPI0023657C78|nr:Gfo/Idh/MocA family oxidoreductase [Novosphingobium sp. KACC 22771]WDF74375.1 Gfo/Idh/MocA family oxidoreductase [Novosphingobium sp. KACC 22771]
MSGSKPLGVGFAGAGPVTQAIHLPTLAHLPDLFKPVCVMDVNGDLAASVASNAGMRHTVSIETLMADPAVDVVAICSPQQFHADQVIAAMRAGKKAVLCEKPLANSADEARAITEVSAETGVPLVVGAMHVFDPAWRALQDALGDLPTRARSIRSSIVLPLNDRFENWASEVTGRPDLAFTMPGEMTPELVRQTFHGLILGLAVHDLPLVRKFLPDWRELQIWSARQLAPFGYLIAGEAGGCAVQLNGTMHLHGEVYWDLEVVTDAQVLRIRFTPSYVHGGSAIATITDASGAIRQIGPFDRNGYVEEWRALYAAAHGDRSAVPALAAIAQDFDFVIDVATKASVSAIGELP